MKSSPPPFLKSEKFLELHLNLQRKHHSVEDKNAIATNVVFTKTIVTFIKCLLYFSLLLFHTVYMSLSFLSAIWNLSLKDSSSTWKIFSTLAWDLSFTDSIFALNSSLLDSRSQLQWLIQIGFPV